jgi:sulfur carrier protein ThiS
MATKKVTSISVNFQKPGSEPEVVKVAKGSTVADLVTQLNIGDYTISHNGNTVKADDRTELVKGDIVRIGLKTKNN